MDQTPPQFTNNATGGQIGGEVPFSFPSYPWIQNSQPQYSATQNNYTTPQYPTPQVSSVQHATLQYPASQNDFSARPTLLDPIFAPRTQPGSDLLPPNSVDIPGQVQISNQELQFTASQFKQFINVVNQLKTQDVPTQISNNASQTPTAPPLDQMDKLPGYENIAKDGGVLPPPPSDPNARGQQPIRADFSNCPNLTKEDARKALLLYVSEKFWYGSQAAKEMTFESLENTTAIHYTLETFAEKRETHWAFESYSGQVIDTAANGPPPNPWAVTVPVVDRYINKTMLLEVPHTASVKSCHDCGAIGKKQCYKCLGYGKIQCRHCHGSGRGIGSTNDGCTWCSGRGRENCRECYGYGQIVCPSCNGKMQLKWFIQLKSIWKVHLVDYIIEKTPMPDDLVRTVTGQIIFEEDAPRVWPVTNFPDNELNKASANCVQQHCAIQDTERVISQRHKIRVVPVARVNSTWKGIHDDFYVYGFENKIYSPNYPQQCCWGCSIL